MALVDVVFEIFVYSLMGLILAIPASLLYLLYGYMAINTMNFGLFILFVSVAASIWQVACSYNKYPPSIAPIRSMSPIIQVQERCREIHDTRQYQVSPQGVKSPCIDGLPTQEKKKRGSKNVEWLITRITTYFIRIFYGKEDQRLAIIYKSVIETPVGQPRPVVLFETKSYIYQGDSLKYPYMALPALDNTDAIGMGPLYGEKPSTIKTRQEIEYTTGHRVIRKCRIQRELYK